MKKLGKGAEGEVYQVDTALVVKRWYYEQTTAAVVWRLKKVLRAWEALDDYYRTRCAVPEFAGYEIIDGGVVTYHQYIGLDEWTGEAWALLAEVKALRIFWDLHPGNVAWYDGKLWLLDTFVENSA